MDHEQYEFSRYLVWYGFLDFRGFAFADDFCWGLVLALTKGLDGNNQGAYLLNARPESFAQLCGIK